MKKKRTLKTVALELLDKYKESETAVICEYSGNINGSLSKLADEIARYEKEIKELCKETEDDTGENRQHPGADV